MPNSSTDRIRRLEAENLRLRAELDRFRRAEHARPAREQDLLSILDHMPSMISYWDRELRNRLANRAFLDWIGVDPAEVYGKTVPEVIGEGLYQRNLPLIEAALRGEEQRFERLLSWPEGALERHALVHYLPHRVGDEVLGYYVLVTDISPVKQAEEALRGSEERYRAVVEDQTEAICRIRVDGSYVFANEVYCRFFGKTPEELSGNKWMPLCHPDDLAHVLAQVRTLAPDNPVVTIENRVYSSTGEVHWMQFVNRGFFSAAGELVEIQSVGRDIDKRKHAEKALQDVLDQLELRVVERTEDVRRLTVEATLAEERERQAIARDLHDDLGQRLHVMRLKVDTLAKTFPEATAATTELRGLVSDASQVVRSLTSQLSPPVLKKLGLIPALVWLTEEMARQYGLAVAFAPDDTRIDLTPAQSAILFRSVRELLINVVKHSGADRARLNVERRGNMLLLTVEDAGKGMADIEETSRAGHGFGLASLRERLTFLGGWLDFQTPEGGGLRVELRLPMAAAEGGAP